MGKGSRVAPPFQGLSRGPAAFIRILANSIHPKSRVAFNPRPYIYQGRPARIGPPERQLALSVGCHENADCIVVRPQQRRNARHSREWWQVEAGTDVHGEHQLDLELGRGLERHDAPEPAIAEPPAVEDDRRVVQWEGAAGAEDIDQWSITRPGAEEHQFTSVEVDRCHREWNAEIGKAAGGYDGLDRRPEGSRLE
jgi:hypothetical protein